MTIKRPKVTLDIIGTQALATVSPQKVLFVGQMLSAGSATSGALNQSVGNEGEENTLFGAKSMIAGAIRAFKVINKNVRVDAIALDDNGGAVDAAGIFTITGPATAAGTLTFFIGSKENHTYEIDISSVATATIIGDALVTAITEDTRAPFSAVNVTGVVTLTAENGGIEGNNIGMQVSGSAVGVSVAITAFTGVATNPTLTNVFDVVGDIRYQTIVWPTSYVITILGDFLDARFDVDNDVLDGVGVQSVTDTLANLKTFGNTLNSESLVIHGNQLINDADYKGSAIFELDFVIAAEFAAIRSLRLQEGTNISRYVISSDGARDQFGGSALASLPYFNTPFFELPLIDIGKEFTQIEVGELNDTGVFVFGDNQSRTTIISDQVVTTYKTNVAGDPDDSFKFLNFVDTISTIRGFMVDNAKIRFAQTRLTSGGLMHARSIANDKVIRAFFTRMYSILSGEDFVLTVAGEDARNTFINNLEVTIDLETRSAAAIMVCPIVTQLGEIDGTIRISFSTN